MSSFQPVALYGLKVSAGDEATPAATNVPAIIRITMAAIDPSAPPEHSGIINGDTPARATLKIVYDPISFDDEEGSDGSDDENYLKALLAGNDDDGDESSSDEETNGGPSDPSKSRKARKQAAAEQMMKAVAANDSDDEMNEPPSSNGTSLKKNKGKAKATSDDEEDSDDEEKDVAGLDEVVICTLDPSKNYQQPLDITICESQKTFFKVSGTHAVYLTGNYILPTENGRSHAHEIYDSDDEEDEYDLSPDEDEIEDEDESDELDDLEDPRITEVTSGDDEPPKSVQKEEPIKKSQNKRAAEDSDAEAANIDDVVSKALKPAEPAGSDTKPLSKRQLKKLKSNAGKAVDVATENKRTKEAETTQKDGANGKSDKKVQFAKNLEQGPSGTGDGAKSDKNPNSKKDDGKEKISARAGNGAMSDKDTNLKKDDDKTKPSLGPKTVQGVLIDDKKLGKGPTAKKGNKVAMRYIGKLQDGKVFDANKKGSPFTFTLGSGEVIKGWDIGVGGMSVGGERRITVPSHLGYGKSSVPGIPPNSKLTFDVKMLEIK